MKEVMIVNCVSVTAASAAIAIACKVTKSAWPLVAFMLVPTFKLTTNTEESEGNIK